MIFPLHLVSNERPYFLIVSPKFQLQSHYTLEVIAENIPISGIGLPILIFLFS